ncbi:MAG: hypothetical protein ACPLZD_01820 [Candidatus Saccharicenans sp.]|nr:MAG: hypothetical protein C0168_04180 [Candidatus Aminicenantes bacterium]HEK84831.1 hypothetical protein [Candidatus Aminicenantes bacterium]
MGRNNQLAFFLALFLFFFFSLFSLDLAAIFTPGETAVQIPVGTKIEVHPEMIVFILSDGRLQVIPEGDILKIKAIDNSGKLIYTGTQARIFTECQPEKFKKLAKTDGDYRFIKFTAGKPELDPAGKGVLIPQGTPIEKVEENLYRFHLPNGETVSFRCKLTPDGQVGDCTRYTKDWKIMYTRTRVKFCRLNSLNELQKMPAVQEAPLWVQFLPEGKF